VFSKSWAKFDQKGKGFIKYTELELIIDSLIYEEAELLLNAKIQMMEGELKKSLFES